MKNIFVFIAAIALVSSLATAQGTGSWQTFFNTDDITSIDYENGHFWVGSKLGLVKFNPATNEKSIYNTINSPLPENKINKVVTSKHGGVWALTNKGAIRFHNDNWVLFNASGTGLPSDFVTDILEVAGGFWFATDKGVALFDGIGWTVYNEENSPLPFNYVLSLAADSLGGVWVGTFFNIGLYHGDAERFGGLARFDGVDWTVYTARNQPQLAKASIYSLEVDAEGALWIGSDFDVTRLSGEDWQNFHIDFTEPGQFPPPFNYIHDITFDSEGAVWLSTSNQGVARYQDGNSFTSFHPHNSDFAYKYVRGCAADGEGRLWFGCNGGLMRFDAGDVWTQVGSLEPGSIPGNRITALTTDAEGNAYVKILGKSGLARFDGSVWQTLLDTLRWDNSNALTRGPQGSIWMGNDNYGIGRYTDNEVEWFNDENSMLHTNLVTALDFDRNGVLWVGTRFEYDPITLETTLGGIARFDGANWSQLDRPSLPDETPPSRLALAVDDQGGVWAGTSNAGVAYYNNAEWEYFTTANSAMPADDSNIITADNAGRIFVSTSEGICIFENGASTAYTPHNSSLPSVDVRGFTVDNAGRLWIATAEGVARFDGDSWHLFTTDNAPLLSNNINAVTIGDDGRVWIGSDDAGIAVYTPIPSAVSEKDEVNTFDLTLSPQPASDALIVRINGAHSGALTAYSLLGHRVGAWDINGPTTRIDIAALSDGIYILHSAISGDVRSYPFVILR